MNVSEIDYCGWSLEEEIISINKKLEERDEFIDSQAKTIDTLKTDISQLNENSKQLLRAISLVSEGKKFMMCSPTELEEIKSVG